MFKSFKSGGEIWASIFLKEKVCFLLRILLKSYKIEKRENLEKPPVKKFNSLFKLNNSQFEP